MIVRYIPNAKDTLVVVDLEATCWEGPPPPGEVQEVIEIGLCMLDKPTGRIFCARDFLVTPTESRVSEFCTRLTTLTQEQLEAEGKDFGILCEVLKASVFPSLPWASWGQFDQTLLRAQCGRRGVPMPFSENHLNLKTLLSEQRGISKGIGMAKALRVMNIPLVGTHHRAGDDALNIAKIAAKMYGQSPELVGG